MSKHYKNDKYVSSTNVFGFDSFDNYALTSKLPKVVTPVDPEDYVEADLSEHYVLGYLLRKKRPFGTEERTFDDIFGCYIEAVKYHDAKGNFMFGVIDVINNGVKPTTIFTAHLDTVEHNKGDNIIINAKRDGKDVIKAYNSILGADDAAGVYAITCMIDRNVSGRYMLFAGEESGGIGSNYAVNNYPELFDGIRRAVAIDRKGTGDVITSQYVGVCASNAFGTALAEALSYDSVYKYAPCNGVYTDTANMIGLVPECVNISSGYYSEHSKQECLDLNYLLDLIDRMTMLDWEMLPTVRKAEPAIKQFGKKSSLFGIGGTYSDEYDDAEYYEDYYSLGGKQTKDADVEDVINLMEDLNVSIADLTAYVKRTGYIELL